MRNKSCLMNAVTKGKEQGLIVSWCPQLEVLAHKATGCFFDCGWSSILEAMDNGVPFVAIPHCTDQPTISKINGELMVHDRTVAVQKGGSLDKNC